MMMESPDVPMTWHGRAKPSSHNNPDWAWGVAWYARQVAEEGDDVLRSTVLMASCRKGNYR